MSKAVKNDYLHSDNTNLEDTDSLPNMMHPEVCDAPEEESQSTSNEEKFYYFSNDPSRTPVSHEMFQEVQRPIEMMRARLRRAGLCCAPRRYVCDGDCPNCRYYGRNKLVPIDSLVGTSIEPRASESVEDYVARKRYDEEMYEYSRLLDKKDQIVLDCLMFCDPKLHTLEETAERIREELKCSYTPQAVKKRYDRATKRLWEFVNYPL